ncbi:ketoacyl-ACP synthase III [Butyrivibrio proteoclasticus]|uniref:ketoacyl-ACP synthase III n=1 Tax=Butyrivibrio proteoclasticus TaxID=43305 RepID=UPI00047A0070|nr:ketoacyl-ACP synthase III [Butyrivibrio proteoclasticus]
MRAKLDNISIVGVSAAVSNKWTPLLSFQDEDLDEKTIKKFSKQTGVIGRYDAGERQTSADLCYSAAKELITSKNIDVHEIGVVILVTQTPDYKSPSSACVIQGRLGLDDSCLAFDINLGCSGYTNSIMVAGSLLKSVVDKPLALLLCGDTCAKGRAGYYNSKTSNASKMLLGDCGTATLLRVSPEECKILAASYTRGTEFNKIISPYLGFRHPVIKDDGKGEDRMDDIEVFNFATTEAPKVIQEVMASAGATPDDYDCLVLHQANLMIMKRIAKLTGFSEDKLLVSIDEFANTASATIPTTLVKKYGETNQHKALRCLMCGYGVGLSWSAVDCLVNEDDIIPLVHTDEYFDDGYYE